MKNIVHADAGVPFLILIAALGFLVCVLQFAVGRYIGHFFKSTVNAGQSLGQKNTAFAIWIAYTYLNPLASVGRAAISYGRILSTALRYGIMASMSLPIKRNQPE